MMRCAATRFGGACSTGVSCTVANFEVQGLPSSLMAQLAEPLVGPTRGTARCPRAGDRCDARGRLIVRRGCGTLQPEARHWLWQRGGVGRLPHLPSAVSQELVGAAGVLRVVLHRVGYPAAPPLVCRARVHCAPPV